VLDSGITPSDAAEFVGYKWQQSGGLLNLGLLSQSYLSTYNRIKKQIDFTGEGRTTDVYGHGTQLPASRQAQARRVKTMRLNTRVPRLIVASRLEPTLLMSAYSIHKALVRSRT